MSDVLGELQQRGLVALTTEEAALRAALAEGPVTYYVGFDPTAPSLHMGNLVQLLLARHLQDAGHRPLMLVGGATGLIGDPRMSGERTLNDREVVAGWIDKIRGQIERFIDFDGPYAARMVNNLDWTGEVSAIDFLRDIGKHFSVNRMLAKEAVSARLNSEHGISFTEFSYQVLQGNDYLELFRRYGCTLQTGGSDQWGNLTSGVDLIRRVERTPVHALATPLITKADGTKFGKTESGTIWLDSDLTSPYAFLQFWLNADDRDVIKYLKVFSFRSLAEIAKLEQQTNERPQARAAQRALAEDVTTLVHGPELTAKALAATEALFGGGEIRGLDVETLGHVVAELPSGTVSRSGVLAGEVGAVDALVSSGLVASKGAARRAIKEGGAYVNNVKVTAEDAVIAADDLLGERYVLLRRGKKTLGALTAE
ncbi:tyrosine--tRNA ligase [Saxibacter everestensis]|uniref:Tyrosine--tRNA ligase n=1 Tax=Saxibacter everestensis TaxID=2909229 RepID=A0ABY8QVX2_9MICO|nr:tyrosine--tRNA ligase [Brevibacteriaceae bacterium ZFBP1038]